METIPREAAVLILAREQCEAVAAAGAAPIRLEDPETRRSYVLIDAEEYERVSGLLAPEEGVLLAPDEDMDQLVLDLQPYMGKVFGPEGWDDPAMDSYNDPVPGRP